MVFTTEGFLEVAIESWPEWDLNQSQLCIATLISSPCSVFTFHFGLCLRQSPHLLLSQVSHR